MEEGINNLVGKTIIDINWQKGDNDKLYFNCLDGSCYLMYHHQDCCEDVYLEDVCGDFDTLLDTPVISAYETTNSHGFDSDKEPRGTDMSFTWTFYNINTIKGSVTLRWYGSSNTYYSESVRFIKTT